MKKIGRGKNARRHVLRVLEEIAKSGKNKKKITLPL